MSFSLIDIPGFVSPDMYGRVMESMLYRLKNFHGVTSVYQIGGVSTPGISDLDMVVVFDDGVSCQQDFRDFLSRSAKYLFIHALYGTSEKMFAEAGKCTFFHNYKLLHGKDQRKIVPLNTEDEKILKQQIAFEFLVKMYIVTTIQRCYGTIKLRALLLEVKAIQYDLEFLGVANGNLAELVNRAIEMRQSWFEKKISRREITRWFMTFHKELEKFLEESLSEGKFFTPGITSFHPASNISVFNGNHVQWKQKGFALPPVVASVFGKRYFNLHHRFNHFKFFVPMQHESIPPAIDARFRLLKQMHSYNNKYLPYFIPLSSSLNMF